MKSQVAALFLVATASAFESGATFSGIVLNPDSLGKAGVEITLTSSRLKTTTNDRGEWTLGTSVGLANTRPLSRPGTGILQLNDNQIAPSFLGRNIIGRITSKSPLKSEKAITLTRESNAPDTLLYSIDGKIWLRDTISTPKTKIIRMFDTSWNASIIYDYITDSRDNNTYRIVNIGTQTWMAENLNFAGNQDIIGVCYNGQNDSCRKHGRLYSWNEVMDDSVESTSESDHVQGICPDGWHVPSDNDWKKLEITAGMNLNAVDSVGVRGTFEATKLKSISGWANPGNGSDLFGFRVLPSGYFQYSTHKAAKLDAYFWSSSEKTNNTLEAWGRNFYYRSEAISRYWDMKEYSKFSLRCLKR